VERDKNSSALCSSSTASIYGLPFQVSRLPAINREHQVVATVLAIRRLHTLCFALADRHQQVEVVWLEGQEVTSPSERRCVKVLAAREVCLTSRCATLLH
jgi:hypothetical protein